MILIIIIITTTTTTTDGNELYNFEINNHHYGNNIYNISHNSDSDNTNNQDIESSNNHYNDYSNSLLSHEINQTNSRWDRFFVERKNNSNDNNNSGSGSNNMSDYEAHVYDEIHSDQQLLFSHILKIRQKYLNSHQYNKGKYLYNHYNDYCSGY